MHQWKKADSPFGKNYAFSTFFDENGEPKPEHIVEFLEALDVEPYFFPEQTPNLEGNSSNNESSLSSLKIGKAMKVAIAMASAELTFEELNEKFTQLVDINRYDCNGLKLGTPDIHNAAFKQPRFYTTPFTSKDGKVFTLISQWYDKDWVRLTKFIEAFPKIFPDGLNSLTD